MSARQQSQYQYQGDTNYTNLQRRQCTGIERPSGSPNMTVHVPNVILVKKVMSMSQGPTKCCVSTTRYLQQPEWFATSRCGVCASMRVVPASREMLRNASCQRHSSHRSTTGLTLASYASVNPATPRRRRATAKPEILATTGVGLVLSVSQHMCPPTMGHAGGG